MYERHDPFAQALHRVVRENLATFYAAIEEGWQTGLPERVSKHPRWILRAQPGHRGAAWT